MLRLGDVILRIGGRELLKGVAARLPGGHRAGLVGRNGSGKTSSLRLITGEWSPNAGEVRLARPAARFGRAGRVER